MQAQSAPEKESYEEMVVRKELSRRYDVVFTPDTTHDYHEDTIRRCGLEPGLCTTSRQGHGDACGRNAAHGARGDVHLSRVRLRELPARRAGRRSEA